MNPREAGGAGGVYLYDAELLDEADLEPLFVAGQAADAAGFAGRGAVRIFHWRRQAYVLRHSHRGGLMRALQDRYLWCGRQGTRVWREWRVLAYLWQAGLSVPRPLAARALRQGWFYRGDLITALIPAAESLAKRLQRSALSAAEWQSVGACLKRLHAAGVFHADLNAHNILLTSDGAVWLVDFDRARLNCRRSFWLMRMHKRLRRSLDKLQRQHVVLHFDEPAWQSLLSG